MKKEGQASVEMMIIIVITLIFLAIILSIDDFVITGVSGSFQGRTAGLLLDTIAQGGDLVYQQGEGARSLVFVAVPSQVVLISLKNRVINMTMNSSSGQQIIYRKTNYNISGTIPTKAGNYWLLMKSLQWKVNVSWFNTS